MVCSSTDVVRYAVDSSPDDPWRPAGPPFPLRLVKASATWLLRAVSARSFSHHGRSLFAARRFQQRPHGRERQHGNRSAVEHHPLSAIQAWCGHDHAAIRVDSLDPNQDLELNAFHHSKDSTRGTYVTAIPGCLIRHDSVLKPVDQFSDGYLIGQDINIPGVDWQPMQGEGGAPAYGPLAVSDGGESLKRPTPCRNWTIHAATIRSAPYIARMIPRPITRGALKRRLGLGLTAQDQLGQFRQRLFALPSVAVIRRPPRSARREATTVPRTDPERGTDD
jgi:hypothetical protein